MTETRHQVLPLTSLTESAPVNTTTALHRAFDVLCAVIGLIMLSPLLAIVAIAIKLDDGGPVFYAQRRVGKDFRVFRMLKFRTMVSGADALGLLTAKGDSRITAIGGLLRRYKLDELPQLFNVVRGDMRLVGVRPEVECYVALFRQEYALLLRDRPGITDPATFAFRREDSILMESCLEEHYISRVLPAKLRLSLDYQRHRTWASDLRVLVRTSFGVLY